MNFIGNAKFNGLSSNPNFSVKKFLRVADQPVATRVFDVRFEVLVNLVQQILNHSHVFFLQTFYFFNLICPLLKEASSEVANFIKKKHSYTVSKICDSVCLSVCVFDKL